MIGDICKLLEAGPFEPFYVVTSSGKRYRVASADHASTNPQGTRLVIWLDDDSSITVSGLHIAAIEKETRRKAKAA
jgi:hypothetical protein